MSRRAPGSPASTERTISAFWAASPPASSSERAGSIPSGPGSIRSRCTRPSSSQTASVWVVVVISSRPSPPCTTNARALPSCPRADARVSSSDAE
jgi:hypothetical protein